MYALIAGLCIRPSVIDRCVGVYLLFDYPKSLTPRSVMTMTLCSAIIHITSALRRWREPPQDASFQSFYIVRWWCVGKGSMRAQPFHLSRMRGG